MKVYLDDVRPAPFGWERVYTAAGAIEQLRIGDVEAISLDHDLAEEHYDQALFDHVDLYGYEDIRPMLKEPTGYDVALWMVENDVWPEEIILHTMNPVGRNDMFKLLNNYAPNHVSITIRPGWRG